VALVEKDEADAIEKNIDNRRLRLDETRKPEQLRKAVELDILGASKVVTFLFLSVVEVAHNHSIASTFL